MGANLAASALIAAVNVNAAVVAMIHLDRAESDIAILMAVNAAGSTITEPGRPKVFAVRDDCK